MTETQKRINAYREALPNQKAKMMAILVILLFAAVMAVGATFAWVVLSRAPEVKGISTTVAANGSLEIALSDLDGLEPDISQVGDSTAAGNDVKKANLTWGNLVNLTDGYGLENLELRPAMLNTSSTTNPLSGATYDKDGRIIKLKSDFAYTVWEEGTDGKESAFVVPNETAYGVRAISSVKYVNLSGDTTFRELCEHAEEYKLGSIGNYQRIVTNEEYIKSLTGLMQVYVQAMADQISGKGGSVSEKDVSSYMPEFYKMMEDFSGAMKELGNAYVVLANIQQFLKSDGKPYTSYTLDTMLAASDSTLKNKGVSIADWATFKKDYNQLQRDITSMKAKVDDYQNNGVKILWGQVSGIVNNVVDINSCTVDGYTMGQLSSHINDFTDGNKLHNTVIYRGSLCDYEGMAINSADYYLYPEVTIRASATVSVLPVSLNIKSKVYTKYRGTNACTYDAIYNNIRENNSGIYAGGDPVAQDTYAMALDFWVRTNTANSKLTLNSVIKTVSEWEDETIEYEGRTYNVFSDVVTGELVDAFQKDGKWYAYAGARVWEITPVGAPEKKGNVTYVDSEDVEHQVYWAYASVGDTSDAEPEALIQMKNPEDDARDEWFAVNRGYAPVSTAGTPVQAKVEKITTVGAEGVNRVWPDSAFVDSTSTMQGEGSFYIYYADTPEDAARSLELLKSMKVAFLNSASKVVATAIMNTDLCYAVNGKYYVPLVVPEDDDQNGVSYADELGQMHKGIMDLPRNQAVRITAIVYLDGAGLTNQQVLAASNIQGTLNIQFGSSVELTSIRDEDLELSTQTISATADRTSFNYETDTNLTTRVTVTIEGDQPNYLTARFQRAISATQGTRMEEFRFSSNGDGTWSGQYTFPMPGKYVLRSVALDGVEKDLSTPIPVSVDGFAITSVTCDKTKIMTAATIDTAKVTVKFAAVDPKKLPKTLTGRFMLDGNATSVTFTYDVARAEWVGSARFTTSGVYTLEYLVMDGSYFQLDDRFRKTVDVLLGMKTKVDIERDMNGEMEVLRDHEGNIVYQTDENGEPLLDENGGMIPIMVPVSGSLSFKLLGGESPRFIISAIIMDDRGSELAGLNNVELRYLKAGSALIEKGLKAELNWNPSTERYEGEWNVTKAGIYSFNSILVESNTITNAVSAPVIQAKSPEPPAYQAGTVTVVGASDGYLFAPNSDAMATAKIAFSSSASGVTAWFQKAGEGRLFSSKATIGSESGDVTTWRFPIPKNGETQDGVWTLVQLDVSGVYDAAGNEYTEENPMQLRVNDAPAVEVVCTVVVEFPDEQQVISLGGTSVETATSGFMEEQSIGRALTVEIADSFGEPLRNVTDVTMVLTHKVGSAKDCGGYTYSEGSNSEESKTLTMTTTNGTTYSTSADVKMRLAGEYTTQSLSFKVNGVPYTYGEGTARAAGLPLPENSPRLLVYTKKPTVTITATDTAAGQEWNVNVGGRNQTAYFKTANYISPDGFYAEIYHKHGSLSFTPCKATLKLADAGAVTSAVISWELSGNVTSYPNTFTFKGNNTTAQSYVGGASGTSMASAVYLGKKTVNSIKMTYDKIEYEVQLSHALEFKNNTTVPASLVFTKPANLDDYRVTLPSTSEIKRENCLAWNYEFPKMEPYTLEGEAPVPDADGEVVKVVITRTTQIRKNEGDTCNTKYVYGNQIETQEQIWTNGLWAKTTRTYTHTGWKLTRTSKELNPSTQSLKKGNIGKDGVYPLAVGEGLFMPGDVCNLVAGYTYTATVEAEYNDEFTDEVYTKGAMTTWENKATEYYDKNGTKYSGMPSGYSVNGSATTAIKYYDEAGNEISKPSWVSASWRS